MPNSHRRSEDRPPRRDRDRPGVRPRHSRIHRTRLGLRLPPDPARTDKRHPRPLPRSADRGDELVRHTHHRRRPDGTGRSLDRPSRRRHPGPEHRAAGVAAAVVQVVGLQRWLTLVPAISQDALDPSRRVSAEQRFELWHTVLGTGIGETAGYTLTALFTVLVVLGLRRSLLRRWLAVAGLIAAGLIATGVIVPLVPAASLTNFAGYILWCAWLLAVAVALFRFQPTKSIRAAEPTAIPPRRHAAARPN